MPVRVLVVDDSAFFRRRLTEIFDGDKHIEVVGSAGDGKEAIEQVAKLKPDVVTMDIEMPIMDGITAVRKIMQSSHPTPVLMFSSLTTDGAKATLDALEAGAMDFLPKKMEDISQDRETAKRQLCARVRLIGARGLKKSTPQKRPPTPPTYPRSKAAPKPATTAPVKRRVGGYRLVAIGASTGGPVALQKVLTGLPESFPLPILLVQHMPATFTPAFAERLNKLSAINIKEAQTGDVLERGHAYLAPGGKQMLLDGRGHGATIRIVDSDVSQTYKPSVDITFGSAAKFFGGDVLAVVLTGMGADGREGCRMLKKNGAAIWSQDEASSVIYGMPAAVAEAGLADRVVSLNDVASNLLDAV
ncbi:chemotaxis response regulator protein-glutamate methylesterase [Pseudomonadota bacterium]